MTDNTALRATVKKKMSREDFKEKELSAFSSLDQWFGVEGISAPLGSPRFMPDSTLESIARSYRRGLEDVRDGLTAQAEPDISDRQVEANLREIERERGIRECLRQSWMASDRMDRSATDDRLEFDAAGGLAMLAEASRSGQEPMIRPSYKLAQFLDYERSLQGKLTALVWPHPSEGSDERKGAR